MRTENMIDDTFTFLRTIWHYGHAWIDVFTKYAANKRIKILQTLLDAHDHSPILGYFYRCTRSVTILKHYIQHRETVIQPPAVETIRCNGGKSNCNEFR